MPAAAQPTGAPQRGENGWNDWLWAVAVFAVALLTRLWFLHNSSDRAWPHSMHYEGDAIEWVNYAGALDRGVPYEFDLPIRSPAVAYLVHWLDPGVAEGPFTGFKVLWCIISALGCSLAYLAARRSFDQLTSAIAAGLCSFSFGSYLAATSLNNECLYTTALMAIVLATLSLIDKPRIWLAIVVGGLHGLATLIRPEHTLMLILASGYSIWRLNQPNRGSSRWRAQWVIPTLVLIASVLVCLPWSIRGSLASARLNDKQTRQIDFARSPLPWSADAQAFLQSLPAFSRSDNYDFISFIARSRGAESVTADLARTILIDEFGSIPPPLPRWVFVSSQGPLSFALANHPEAGGGFSKAALRHPRFPGDPRLNLTMPSHLELYSNGYAVGLGYIRDDPGLWITNVGRKLASLSEGVTLGMTSLNLPHGNFSVRRPIDLATPDPLDGSVTKLISIAWKVVVISTVILGIVLALRRRIPGTGIWLAIIVYKLIVVILFYGYARQGVSILPAFYVVMALPIAAMVRPAIAGSGRAAPRWRSVIGATLIALVLIDLLGATFRPPLVAHGQLERRDALGMNAFQSFETIQLRPFSSDDGMP